MKFHWIKFLISLECKLKIALIKVNCYRKCQQVEWIARGNWTDQEKLKMVRNLRDI